MATSTDILTCEALRDLIRREHPTWTVNRVHLPQWDKAPDLKAPRVEINPGSIPAAIDSTDYDSVAVEWPIVVTFAAPVADASTATSGNADKLDALLDECESLRVLCQSNQFDLENGSSVHCQSFEYRTRMDVGLIDREGETYAGTFLAVMYFVFREVS